MTAGKNILSRTDNEYLLLIEGTRSTTYAERAQNPCKLGRECVQTVDKFKWRNRRNQREAWRRASRKKKWRRFHAKHEIRTKKLRCVNIPRESVNEYDWLQFSQPFFSLQVLLHHDSNCFR